MIPIIYSFIALNEEVSIAQWIGVALLAVALTLSVWKKEEKKSLKCWLPAAIIAMICSGTSAIIQKNHQSSIYAEEIYAFLVCLFFSTIFTGVAYLLTRETAEEKNVKVKNKKKLVELVLPLCLGACSAILSYLNLMLSGKLLSVVQFPTYNVGSLLLVSIISFVFYKEKTTHIQKIGFCLGIVAILIIGLL